MKVKGAIYVYVFSMATLLKAVLKNKESTTHRDCKVFP